MKDLALASVVEQGVRFETGLPVTFRYLRNTEKSPFMGSRFGQDIEPAGRYLLHNEDPGQTAATWEAGIVTFQKPLVLKLSLDDNIYGPTGWKARLRDAYGATGVELSRRLLADGWDGIVTVAEFLDVQGRVHMDTREIVDLAPVRRNGRTAKRRYYHGSRTPLEVGTVISPRPGGYVQTQYDHGGDDNWVERFLEKRRPDSKLSRLKSVFLMDTPDPDLAERLGGYGDHVYEVEPLGPVEASHLHWAHEASISAGEDRKRAADAYWRGDRSGRNDREYRTPAARVVRRVGGTARKNPALGAAWLTPQVEARLRDIERRHIKGRTRLFGRDKGLFVCETAPDEALDLVEVESGMSGNLVHGVVLHHGLTPSNWPNVDIGQLKRPYLHWWIELDDGTIVDVASSQFGQRSPLVIPPRHPMQRLYVKEDPDADELPSGYAPLLIRNPETSLEAFLQELPTFLRSPEALEALDGMPVRSQNPWLGGGCFVLAEALARFLGPKAVALDVESLGLDLHAVVEVEGVWIDGRGAYPPSEAKRLFPGMAGVTRHEAMADSVRVEALVAAMRSRFGRVR